MEADEIPMTEKESLALITNMINQAKNRLNENGFLYLLWGWLILICSLSQFFFNYFFEWKYSFVIWYSTWILLAYQIRYLKKRKKQQGAVTYTDDITKNVWITMAVCAGLLIFIMFVKPQSKGPMPLS